MKIELVDLTPHLDRLTAAVKKIESDLRAKGLSLISIACEDSRPGWEKVGYQHRLTYNDGRPIMELPVAARIEAIGKIDMLIVEINRRAEFLAIELQAIELPEAASDPISDAYI